MALKIFVIQSMLIPFLALFYVECCKNKLTTPTNIEILASFFGFISSPLLVL
jgi:hypothetical protein